MRRKVLLLLLLLFGTQPFAARQECLGRLFFAMPEHFEWATAQPKIPMGSGVRFSKSMAVPADSWNYNRNTKIIVTKPTTRNFFDEQWRVFMPSAEALIKQRAVVKAKEDVVRSKLLFQQRQKDMLAKGELPPSLEHILGLDVDEASKHLEAAQKKLDAMEGYSVPWAKLAIADARSIDKETQRAFVWRNERVYMFYLSNRGYPEFNLRNTPITVDDANALLSGFKARVLGELPLQTGFCFPYGFIEDDGSVVYEIKNSFRFADQPNVAFSLYTGDVNLFTRPSVARQGILNTSPPALAEPERFSVSTVEKNLILANGNTLTLYGWSIEEKQPVDPEMPQYHYLVYGKVEGDLTRYDKPYIGVQIRSFDRNEADDRPSYAPPLDEAIERLRPLLESIEVNRDRAPTRLSVVGDVSAVGEGVKAQSKSVPVVLLVGIFIMLISTFYGVLRVMSHLKRNK